MKYCKNGHSNPDNANFCRICGTQDFEPLHMTMMVNNDIEKVATSGKLTFTPDRFPNINLIPCSAANVNFQCKKGLVLMVPFIWFMILTIIKVRTVSDFISMIFGISFHLADCIVFYVSLFIFLIGLIMFLLRLCRCHIYKENADYIEETAFMSNLYRIAKNGKLGLFDKRRNTVKMGSHYDNISEFDSEHILMVYSGKKGLFSIKKKGVIVPIDFDHIDAFKNSIVRCYKGTESYYYDVNGNRMK